MRLCLPFLFFMPLPFLSSLQCTYLIEQTFSLPGTLTSRFIFLLCAYHFEKTTSLKQDFTDIFFLNPVGILPGIWLLRTKDQVELRLHKLLHILMDFLKLLPKQFTTYTSSFLLISEEKTNQKTNPQNSFTLCLDLIIELTLNSYVAVLELLITSSAERANWVLVPLKGILVWLYNFRGLECSTFLLSYKCPFIFPASFGETLLI